ncbi:MAG: molybdopterin converting factor subunit 1 [Alphaproteobacteria bacterium]
MARLLYFANLRERAGVAEEEVSLPAHVRTGRDLLTWLKERHPALADLLEMPSLRMAIDQELKPISALLGGAREIALFPPMTGG